MYFINGAKTKVKVELVGGPFDGLAVACPLAPPPCFLLPTGAELEVSVYSFYSLAGKEEARLKYTYSGVETLTPDEMARLQASPGTL
ncbi:MAG: hypothetical protein SFV17_23670 [Candidatus Obscuribacter sp.]|nr:hypothetical protein [Candidatus Melainabacteria bacterium]MDX1989710.1 hypothetical protein [Candidatus Obscuribacter sp.]